MLAILLSKRVLFLHGGHFIQVIQSDGTMWRLVMMDENKSQGLAPPIFQRILRSNFFHTFILILVLLDASIAASLSFNHRNKRPADKLDEFYYAEVSYCRFTVFICLITKPEWVVKSMSYLFFCQSHSRK